MLAEDPLISEEKQRFLEETERMIREVLNNNQPYTAVIERLQRLEDEFPRIRSAMDGFRRSQDELRSTVEEFRTSIVEEFRRSQNEIRASLGALEDKVSGQVTELKADFTELKADFTELKADNTELKAEVYKITNFIEDSGNSWRRRSTLIIWNANGFESNYPRTLIALQNSSLDDINVILRQYGVPTGETRRRTKRVKLRILERFYREA
ncbi:hypothetical protein CLIB1444_04S03752 [[Candida] jaroonii]|uniref:Uncharacterized protein n=1 Tax=[Candida] jaroonii TaxID=467808 RepID=A0ACA9Y6I6_9ASCO|nr:hypothetical protein CLIB1444_04S03752 [[Candida] jaroonii]